MINKTIQLFKEEKNPWDHDLVLLNFTGKFAKEYKELDKLRQNEEIEKN